MSDQTETIRDYLTKKFPSATVEHHGDSSSDRTFKLLFKGDTRLLKVAREFVDDNSTQDILKTFDKWDLKGTLASAKALGVLVTNSGLSTFQR